MVMFSDKNEIVRMDFVGSATIFRFSVVSPNRVRFMEKQFAKTIGEFSFMLTMDFLN